jgi:Cu/Ag efflux pump CusA
MIERLIELSIRNRFMVLVLAAALTVAGIYAMLNTPVDAIPDLSENQVIVFTDWMGRSPREIEDQVTYPLSRKLQGLAGVKAVRSSSEFNFSMITIIFEDKIDFYFARQRVTEKLSQANTFLPTGVMPYLAPDATALGQVFWYTVEPTTADPVDPSRLWALNKFYIAPQLNAAPGVSDVAIVGGTPLEYQIDVRPESLRAYGITLGELYAAVGKSNMPAGGGVIQKNNAEYIVRGVGWIKDKQDIENTVIKEVSGTPIYVSNIATVQLGTQFRRSVYEKDGNEVVGGVVLMRHGQNPLEVTERVKAKIQELQPALPKGIHIVPAYDRTRLIHGAIHTLTEVMWHEMVIASIAILLILVHVRSVFVICITLPLAVLFSFLMMWVLRVLGIIDIQANIMSLAGITISIGILVDQAIVMTENATHHLKAHFGDRNVTGDIRELVIPACRTVGRPIFFSVMIMLISFIPVFMLTGREGKYFHPLAFTKSFALLGVALISVTLVPALIPTFIKGRLRSEEDNPIVRSFIEIYKPFLTWALPRLNLVAWLFAVLLIIFAGMFPLQAIVGLGTSERHWKIAFFIVFIVVTVLSTFFMHGKWEPGFRGLLTTVKYLLLSLALLAASGMIAWLSPILFGELAVTLPLLGPVAPLKWLCYVAALVPLTALCAIGFRTQRLVIWQALSVASLVVVGMWSYHLNKIGVAFMPALDEGTTLDMPITVPRASVTQAADDLKARDALLRGFPEVESVIGKAGRADTPTDPAPLDMVETFVNFRPKEFWPKRVIKFKEAAKHTGKMLVMLEEQGYVIRAPHEDDRESLVNDATQKALERFDETLRELALLRYVEFERELGPILTRFVVTQSIERIEKAGNIRWPEGTNKTEVIYELTDKYTPEYGVWLAKNLALEDIARLTEFVAVYLADHDCLRSWYEVTSSAIDAMRTKNVPEAVRKRLEGMKGKQFVDRQAFLDSLQGLLPPEELSAYKNVIFTDTLVKLSAADALEVRASLFRKTFAGEVLKTTDAERLRLWRERIRVVNWELYDRGAEAYCWYSLEELVKAAKNVELINGSPHSAEAEKFADASLREQLGKTSDRSAFASFLTMSEAGQKIFRNDIFLWPRQTGPKGDLVDDEMGRVLQVPGWSNIFTQPIINRIEMLSTGVRTDIGVKVFGPDLDTIDGVCKQIEAALKPINGARDVIAAPIMGKGYLQIDIDRKTAARYGISVEDIQNEIEVALAGRAVTFTVEQRDRFPVRIRYARTSRDDPESIGRLLISPGGMATSASSSGGPGMGSGAGGMSSTGSSGSMSKNGSSTGVSHAATPQHAARGSSPIPLGALAKVQIVEGPAMIKSENGRLLNYVTLNVRGRDIVGFVDQAQRVVAQKIKLPEGVHIEWSGEFEHQVRAARTLGFVFPAVVILIFVILYMTYNDLMDALLMMLAVPEALAGGAFFMYLFPKIMQGWDAPPVDFSVAVWVGFIACFGMATETGIIMLVYLREAIEKRGGLENIQTLEELRQAVIEGAVHRLRPKLLTEGVAIIAIFPMVFAKGVGGEILAPMALPVLGGLLISDEVVDLFLPVRFYWVRRARWLKLHAKDRLHQATDLPPAETPPLIGTH